MAAIDAEVPVSMRKVYRRLERWRSKRQGRALIPESLWVAAGELARVHGVNPVSRVLRLEFNHLRRVAESDRQSLRKPRATPAFVELITPQTTVTPTCIVELNGQHGSIRIEWKATTAELARFSRALWEMIA